MNFDPNHFGAALSAQLHRRYGDEEVAGWSNAAMGFNAGAQWAREWIVAHASLNYTPEQIREMLDPG